MVRDFLRLLVEFQILDFGRLWGLVHVLLIFLIPLDSSYRPRFSQRRCQERKFLILLDLRLFESLSFDFVQVLLIFSIPLDLDFLRLLEFPLFLWAESRMLRT